MTIRVQQIVERWLSDKERQESDILAARSTLHSCFTCRVYDACADHSPSTVHIPVNNVLVG